MYKILDKQNLILRLGLENVSFTFIFSNYYSLYEFHSIMPDSRAAKISSVEEPQVLTLQKRDSSIQIDTLTARDNNIRFGKGIATAKGIIQVLTSLSIIIFHVVPINILFFLCL